MPVMKGLLAPQNTFLDTIATRFDGTRKCNGSSLSMNFWYFSVSPHFLSALHFKKKKRKKGVFLVAAFLVFSLPLLEEKKEFHMSLIGAQYQNRKSAGGQTLMWVKFCFTVRQKQKIDLQKSFCLFTFVSHG